MRLLKSISTVFDRINLGFASISAALILILVAIICYAVFMRYLFHDPPGWDVEISEDMLLYITFLGTAWLLKQKGHISVDLVYDWLSPNNKRLINIIFTAICIIMCLIMTWYSAAATVDYIQRVAVDVKPLKLPKAVLSGIISLGFFLLTVEFIRQFGEHIGSKLPSKVGIQGIAEKDQ